MAKARDAWVTFEVKVTQVTRSRKEPQRGRPIRVEVATVAIGYGLEARYREPVYVGVVAVPEDFELAGAPEYAAELAADALRKAYPGLF